MKIPHFFAFDLLGSRSVYEPLPYGDVSDPAGSVLYPVIDYLIGLLDPDRFRVWIRILTILSKIKTSKKNSCQSRIF